MKKFLCCVLVSVFILAFVPAVNVYANGQISVTIDGVPVRFDGQQPASVDGRTLVPVRGVFEILGFDVDWNRETQQATLTSVDYTVILTIGSAVFTTNGESHMLDVPAQLIGGSTMIPIRLPLESVGFYVDWDRASETVIITSEAPDITAPLVTVPPPTTPTRNFSAAHLNAPRPTPERFMELALELEYLAGTDVANGFLNGVLYRAMQSPTAERYIQGINSATGRDPMNSAFRNVARHPNFTRWYTINRTSIGQLAPLAYTNLTGSELYAAYVVLLSYYGIFGTERFSSFGMGPTLELDHTMTVTDVVSFLADINQSTYEFNAMTEGLGFNSEIFPELWSAGWANLRRIDHVEILHRNMNPQQVRSTATRNINGLEALMMIYHNTEGRPMGPVSAGVAWQRFTASPEMVNRLDRAFPMLNSLDLRGLDDAAWDAQEALPMIRTEQRNGTRAIRSLDAYILLWAYENGVVGRDFDPYGYITLREFITMYMRYLPLVSEFTVDLDRVTTLR